MRTPNVATEIADLRLPDVLRELKELGPRELVTRLAAAPAPRDAVGVLIAPGLHIIAEVRRRSPDPESTRGRTMDITTRARACVAGGAAIISVLCEPRRGSGSLADLRDVRAAVDVPIMAKEFVVEPRQLDLVRAAGADLVLLIAALHPDERLESFVERAIRLGLEPVVEVHDEDDVAAALATEARIISINNRDLETLRVDPETAIRLRPLVPDDRIVVVESGVRDEATVRSWRAFGFDGAIIGEPLMRAPDPEVAAHLFVVAGAAPDDLVNRAAEPFVKICGVTSIAGALAAKSAGADAIGLDLTPGHPHSVDLFEAIAITDAVRKGKTRFDRPAVIAVTSGMDADELRLIEDRLRPDAIQMSGAESLAVANAVAVPIWRTIYLPSTDAASPAEVERLVDQARGYMAGGVARVILLAPLISGEGQTGQTAMSDMAVAIAREVPVLLGGGLTPANVAAVARAAAVVGVDVSSGVEAYASAGVRPTKDPVAVALFVKRAKASRTDRPTLDVRPTPVHPGLLRADNQGRFGIDLGPVSAPAESALTDEMDLLAAAWAETRDDPRFWADLRDRLGSFEGRPTPLYRADRLAALVLTEARRIAAPDTAIPSRLRMYIKREDIAATRTHAVDNALGQALFSTRLGKSRVVTDTRTGQHGVATAMACAVLDVPCVIYMGAADIERETSNVARMIALGADVRAATSGEAGYASAINEAMTDWMNSLAATYYLFGSDIGQHPYPTMVADIVRRIGDEAAAQLLAFEGRLPDVVIAPIGHGADAIGFLARFIAEPDVRLAVVTGVGDGAVAHSPGAPLGPTDIGTQLAALQAAGRLERSIATDSEAYESMQWLTRAEGILPLFEAVHPIAALPRLLAGLDGSGAPWPEEVVAVLVLSGHSDTHFDYVANVVTPADSAG